VKRRKFIGLAGMALLHGDIVRRTARNTIIIFPPSHYIEIDGHRCLFPVPYPVLCANGAFTQNPVILSPLVMRRPAAPHWRY